MSKRKAKQAKSSAEKPQADPSPTQPPLMRQPEHKGTPLRPDQFPTMEQAAQLAAILAQGKVPRDDTDAATLANAALRLWRVSRDEINLQKIKADVYWSRADALERDKKLAWKCIHDRLEKLGASGLIESQKVVPWKDAAALLWKNAKPKDRDANLSNIVSQQMVGKGIWKGWTLESFQEFGFESALTFPSLIGFFDEMQTEAERRAKSEEMREKGRKSGEVRRGKAPSKNRPTRRRSSW